MKNGLKSLFFMIQITSQKLKASKDISGFQKRNVEECLILHLENFCLSLMESVIIDTAIY